MLSVFDHFVGLTLKELKALGVFVECCIMTDFLTR